MLLAKFFRISKGDLKSTKYAEVCLEPINSTAGVRVELAALVAAARLPVIVVEFHGDDGELFLLRQTANRDGTLSTDWIAGRLNAAESVIPKDRNISGDAIHIPA